MNYVGKFFSNFKGFYNDINSATLTGAIDILVVRKEDGSFTTSPWHVRFGKMGVIRAREKVVDIEINGEPVQLYMKLGEAGEAFFVQEAEFKDEVPNHLSTSPVPSNLEFCRTDDTDDGNNHEDMNTADAHCMDVKCEMCQEKYCDTVIIIDGDNVTFTEVPKVSEAECELEECEPSNEERVTMDNNHYFTSHNSLSTLRYSFSDKKTTVATQTEMSGYDVEAKKCKSRNVSGETFSSRSQSPFPDGIHSIIPVSTGLSLTSADQESTKCGDKEEEEEVTDEPLTSDDCDSFGHVVESNISLIMKEDEVKEMIDVNEKKKSDDHQISTFFIDVAIEQGSARPIQNEIFEMELSDDDGTERQNEIIEKQRSILEEEQEWVGSAFASTFHPFSDTDITPGTSPLGSRPPSPKSDSEFETQKYDATAQTHLTGDELMLLDDIKWEWGEFPQPSPIPNQMQYSNNSKIEEKPSGGLFQFMRRTKKLRHQPLEGGIYLEDLNLDEMDPEVAALYLYKPKSHLSTNTSKDEDNESGQGLSLPQSPVTFDSSIHVDRVTSDAHLSSSSDGKLYDMALSLCGGLQDLGVNHERFIKYIVSFESFCDNPNLLTDPNLVVRLNGKFYNWSVAAPIIMSILVFRQGLVETSVEHLIKDHMPKKERRRGLWWWSRATSTTADNKISIKSSSSVLTNASIKDISSDNLVKLKTKIRKNREERERSTSGEESEEQTIKSNQIKSHTKEKYKKSLKITTEQIASLKLRDGSNEVTFSVTTQYQGTSRCHCYLYLWNWDDRIIVSDIDGTITRSDVWGQVLPMIGKDWSQAGIANLYSMISQNGYKFLYLSARAIGQSRITRDYLHSVRQGNLCLPEGPLLLSPSSLISAFYKEVIERKPEEFKIGCLRDISILFPPSRTPFYAGFGNKINDTFAYRAVGIPISRIFTVNHKGELSMGLSFQSSYTKLSDIVDHFFPPLLHCDCHHEVIESGKFPGATEYSDFTYWREPFPDIQEDLARVVSTKAVKSGSKKKQEKQKQMKKGRKK